MDRASLIAHLDKLYAAKRAAGQVAFERLAADFIDTADPPQEDREAARAHMERLAATLPVIGASEADVQEAARISHRCAQRLAGAPWYRTVIDTWPAPAAHELEQFVAVLTRPERPSPEAALLQLRDVSDTLAKLPASVLAAALLQSGGASADWVRDSIVEVVGGKWLEFGREAAKRVQAIDPGGPLKALAGLFDNSRYIRAVGDLQTARNNELGHAALRPNPAETAALVSWYSAREPGDAPPDQDSKPGLTTLAMGLADGAGRAPWAGLRLQAIDGDTVLHLTGAAALRDWHADPAHGAHDDRALPMQLAIDGRPALPLRPFLAARICRKCGRRDVFFFDSIRDRKPLTADFIDYGRGHRSRWKGAELPEVQDMLRGVALPPPLADKTLNHGSAIEALDRMRVDRRYRSPHHLRGALRSFMAGTDRGVFWLQAPAHVGKTTFVQGLALPVLREGPLSAALPLRPGREGGVAAFFCRREYRDGCYAFLKTLADSIIEAFDLTSASNVRFPHPDDVLDDPSDKRAAMGRWLAAWRTLKGWGDRPLLIAVDGLDEADRAKTEQDRSGLTLLDLLPRPADLPAQTWLLLTSRLDTPGLGAPSDTAAWLAGALRPVTQAGGVEVLRLGLDSPEYLKLLHAYAEAELKGGPAAGLGARLVRQSDFRFNSLAFLVEQFREAALTPEELDRLGTGLGVFDRYIEGLDSRYGEKRADAMREVIATLTAAERAHARTRGEGRVMDPATGTYFETVPPLFAGLELSVVASAVQMDERPDAQGRRFGPAFVETLVLLQGVLWVWREPTGEARYRLGLREFVDRFATLCPAPVRRGQAALVELCLAAAEALDDAPTWDEARASFGADLFRATFPLLAANMSLSGEVKPGWKAERQRVGTVAVDLEASSIGALPSGEQVRWYSAVAALLEPIERMEVEVSKYIAAAYVNRGIAKQSAPGHGPAAAITDYDAAIRLMQAMRDTLGEGWPVPWRNDLARAYMNRGNAKQDAPGHGLAAAITDYDAAIRLREALRDTLGDGWPVPWRNDLASAYVNRGNAKQSAPGHGPAAAITDYDAAIRLREALRDTSGEGWPVPWRNQLASTYVNRGNAKQSAPGHGPAAAITDYDAAIRLMQAMRDTLGEGWPVPWRNDLARAYMNRGNAKQDAPGHGLAAAITDYDAAIRLREALRDTLGDGWPVPWRNQLASAYVGRGNAKRSAPGHGPAAAITDHDAAIRLMEALRDTSGEGWPVPWRNDLANAYMNRGNAKQSAPGHGPAAAIMDYDAAIRLMEALRDTLGEGWPVPWRNDLANAYVNRGNAKQDAPGHGPAAAITDYDAAIQLMEALRDTLGEGWPVPWRNDLANAYMNRGNAKQDAPGHGPAAAITDYDAAIRLREALRDTLGEGWPVPWRNDLAGAYMNRGNAKQSAPGHGPAAAITDYDAAIRLQEALRDTLGEGWPVPWRNDLAGACVNRGIAKQSAPGHGPAAAIMDYDAAIRLMEALRDTSGEGWPVPWRNDLARAYMNRGNAKQDAPGHGPAAGITDYDAAIRLREALRDTLGDGWPVPWRNQLASAYVGRGNAKQSAPGHGPAAAITDYDAAIRLMEALRDTSGEGWPVPWRNDLANAYMNRGNAKQSAPGHGPAAAITDYDAAIRLREALRDTLGEGWPVPWRNDLASAYYNRAGLSRSRDDADQAVQLWADLVAKLGDQCPPEWQQRLAQAQDMLRRLPHGPEPKDRS